MMWGWPNMMGGFFGGGEDSGPSKEELARQEKERLKVEKEVKGRKDALARKRQGRASLVSQSETGVKDKADTLGG